VGALIRSLSQGEDPGWQGGLEDLFAVVMGEFERWAMSRAIAMDILGRLSQLACQAVSWEAFAKPLASASRDTLKSYVRFMGESFLLATVQAFDASRGRAAPKKDRKLVWMDPALAHLAAWCKAGEIPEQASLAEHVAGAHLLRNWEPFLGEGVAWNRSVFTWRSAKGNEIDYLIVPEPKSKPFPVEVKYQSTITDWDFQSMERAFGKGILVTKDTAKSRPKSQALPLAQFLQTPKIAL
jgi:predicted AAA+ superfamily ATPase